MTITMAETKQGENAPQKVKLTISQILSDLQNGLDRKQIGAKYSLSGTDVKRLFDHPKLKGRKVIKAAQFDLEDDAPEVAAIEFKPRKPRATGTQEEVAEQQEQSQLPETTGEIKEVPEKEQQATTGKKGVW